MKSFGEFEMENIAPPIWGEPKFKVKFMQRGLRRGDSPAAFLRQFPGLHPQWGNCLFDFDVDCRDYDWLVVDHDIPPGDGVLSEEKLSCPKERTMLITGEPSSITVYGVDYLNQYGCILSFQEPWAMRHPNVIFHQPGLRWYYGLPFGDGEYISWDQLAGMPPPEKNCTISTVCSERTGRVTIHSSRVKFTRLLKAELPELDVFGHGVRTMVDKAEALDPYKYHIVVENHVFLHHLTEKMPDAFLGYCLPFYHGAPNAGSYFPKESFIPIDINNYARTRDIIKSHIANNEYEDRLPYITVARRLVLMEQNLFAIIDRMITDQEEKISTTTMGKVIRNRSTMRIKNPLAGVRSLTEKALVKTYLRFTSKSRQKPKDL